MIFFVRRADLKMASFTLSTTTIRRAGPITTVVIDMYTINDDWSDKVNKEDTG